MINLELHRNYAARLAFKWYVLGIIGLVLGIAFLLVTLKIFTSLRNGMELSLI